MGREFEAEGTNVEGPEAPGAFLAFSGNSEGASIAVGGTGGQQ